jgi:hypothetical protein
VLVQTAKVEGVVQSQDGTLPQGTQVSLVPMDQIGMPPIPGASGSTTRAGQDGRFIFTNVAPGQYRVNARANVRAVDPAQPQDAAAPPADADAVRARVVDAAVPDRSHRCSGDPQT